MADVADSGIPDVAVTEVWDRLRSDPKSVLIDVRTKAEWNYVGVPDLSALGKAAVLIEWQTYPDGNVDPAFAEKLKSILTAQRVEFGSELFFICRSGVRSKAAAQAMMATGYRQCRNVAGGFEGPLDPSRHRGRLAGWKAAGLAWAQG